MIYCSDDIILSFRLSYRRAEEVIAEDDSFASKVSPQSLTLLLQQPSSPVTLKSGHLVS